MISEDDHDWSDSYSVEPEPAPILQPFKEPECQEACDHGVRFDADHACAMCDHETDKTMGILVSMVRDAWIALGRPGVELGVEPDKAFKIWKSGWVAGAFGDKGKT